MTNQSVARALDLLIALESGPQSLEACATRLDVHKSTALRLLQTLEAQGFVTHDVQHRYRLGRRVFALASAALDQWDVRGVAHPHLERLNAVTGQTVHLAVFEDGEAVYIDKFEATGGIRMYSRIGLTAPLHCTGVGKVLVADRPDRARIAGTLSYERKTEHTIATATQYLAELERVRTDGYARDAREHESFINCVAAPIRDATGAVVAAASVSVPTVVMDEDQVLALLPDLRRATTEASADMGWGDPFVPDENHPREEGAS